MSDQKRKAKIVSKIEAKIKKGASLKDVCKSYKISAKSYYNWRKQINPFPGASRLSLGKFIKLITEN